MRVDERTTFALVSVACAAFVACAGEAPKSETPVSAVASESPAPAFADDDASWGKFHSKRFAFTLPLPEGRAWKIDDHASPSLVAKHASTRSTLIVRMFVEPDLMNRQRCEDRARELGLVPQGRFATVEDNVTVGPEAFDTRVWAALEPGASDEAPIVGHLFAFGAYIHKCLFVHYTSEVPSARHESALSARLALVRVRVLGRLSLDDFDAVARERPR